MNSNDNEDKDIKSTAVVMYSVPKPAQFTKLKCNTDLNLPPSNWLSNSADSYGLQQVLYQHKGFSSFRMAHLFPDCVGEVDVVSDSDNIKKLLKIPYNKGHISMMVHRIENTLLLDDFNIYKHLLRNAETEWEWLRKFFCENVESKVIEDERTLYIRDKRIKALQQKCLNSKFLYHSLGKNIERLDLSDDLKSQSSSSHSDNNTRSTASQRGESIPESNHVVDDPLLPDPAPHQTGPKSTSSDQKYNRNVVWTFEDISMLIGTDLPIFGGGTHPCLSLRLREMNKPINVLTGIDYWLDNLMSNVPELAMCYHLNGIVQKYELVKTEDLPSMENSKFSPKLIRDVAQSILSFLKSNATKAGHTYWLFKGKNEEVVKLYDLTSLCANDSADSNQNPFIVPVAMLLYSVARNMKHSNGKACAPTIRMLLRNAIKLLNGEKHAEIVTSAHYMLSDVYVPSDTNPDEPDSMLLDDQTEDGEDDRNSVEDEYDFEEQEYSEGSLGDNTSERDDNVPMKVLPLTTTYSHQPTITRSNTRDNPMKQDPHKTPPALPNTVEERCMQSIGHISAGLNCLQFISEDKSESRRNSDIRDVDKNVSDDNVRMANRTEAIPMPYSPLKKSKDDESLGRSDSNKALLLKNKGETQPWRADIPWKAHLKRILYEKAILVYTTLSEHYFRTCNYGSSLRSLALLVRCLHVMAKLNNSPRTIEGNSIIASRAGDCCILITKNWISTDVYSEQVHKHCDQDLSMLKQIQSDERLYEIDLSESPMKYVLIHDIRTLEQILLQALECYQQANLVDDSVQILKRLGNCYNELGSYYLNCAKGSSKSNSNDPNTHKIVLHHCSRAEPYLHKGLEVFERVKDESNIALLCSNLGHLHRMLVYCHVPKERGPLRVDEKVHFNKAIQHYKKALQVLGLRKHNPKIWDAVNWELSSALFTLATILHEFPVDKTTDNEKAVIETFQKVLRYCDFNVAPELLPVYQIRAATVYYRLGCIHHTAICDATCSDQKRKRIIQLANVNYNKGATLFAQCGDVLNLLTVQHQHWALVEYLADSSSSLRMKLKHQQSCLKIIVYCKEVIKLLVDKSILLPTEDTQQFDQHQASPNTSCCTSLLVLLKQRLQVTLKSLLKSCLVKPPIQKECSELLDKYKNMYSLSLSLEHEREFESYLTKLDTTLNDCASY